MAVTDFNCEDCEIVIIDNFVPSSTGIGGSLRFMNPFTGVYFDITYPYFESGEIAKFDSDFWIKCPNPNGGDQIKRFVITDSDCSIGHAASGPAAIIDSNLYPNTGNGLCAKNASTLIMGSVSIFDPTTNTVTTNNICEVDVSTNTAVVTPLFQANGFVSGDIVYIPTTDTIVAMIDVGSGVTNIIHYEMNGNVLGVGPVNFSGSGPDSLFSYEEHVYIHVNTSTGNITAGMYKFDLVNYSVNISTIFNIGPNIGDAASSPNYCEVEPKFCYEIGDITDPNDPLISGGAGGMVFATPFTGLNQTPYYYEVALDDLSTGTVPFNSVTIDDVYPFSQAANSLNGQSTCGQLVQDPQLTISFPPAGTTIYDIDTTISNQQARYPYGANAWPDPLHPFPPGAPISSITIGSGASLATSTQVQGLDFNGNSVWSSSVNPVLASIILIPANTTAVPGTGQTVMSLPYASYLFTFNAPMSNPTSAFYLKTLTILSPQGYQPFSTTGAEWGNFALPLTLPTHTDFGTGFDNTQNIVNNPVSTVWPNHDIAAELCANYFINSPGTERWYLPSLMEFHLLSQNLGPGTPFASNLGLNTGYTELQNTYWTSSAINDIVENPLYPNTGPQYIGNVNPGTPGSVTIQSLEFAWAYTATDPNPPYNAFSLTPGPHAMSRCQTLSVRPIRRFECVERQPDPVEPFNWVDNSMWQPGITFQQMFPFTGIGLPATSGSGWNEHLITGPEVGNPSNIVSSIYAFDGVIGLDMWTHTLYRTDAAGNMFDAADFDDANNPDGYTIKIWTANKIFLGEWHYQNCEIILHGTSPYIPHIFEQIAFQHNLPWFNDRDFPGAIRVKFTNPTHVRGSNPILAYGTYNSALGQDQIRNKHVSGAYIEPVASSHWDYLPNPKLHYVYNNEYEEGTFQGHTSSFAFMHISCKMIDAKPLPLPNIHTAQNTTWQQKNVVCLKDIFNEVKSLQGPMNTVLAHETGGNIGVSPGEIAIPNPNSTMPGQPSTGVNIPGGGTLWNFPNNTNIYGSLVVTGGSSSAPGPVTLDFNPGDVFPKHHLFTWHASFDPDPISNMPIFNNFLDGFLSATCGPAIDCGEYMPGDTGPAGGIIVAIPYMNINDPANNVIGPVVPPLQGTEYIENPTDYYYEITPQNLNFTSCTATTQNVIEWGSYDFYTVQAIDLNTTPYQDYWVPENNYYPGYSVAPGYENFIAGEGLGNTIDMYNVNNGNPTYSDPYNELSCNCYFPNVYVDHQNAFERCQNYVWGAYNDWFLPTTEEMAFARNYTPVGTLYDSTNVSNALCGDPNFIDRPYYWTSNALKDFDTEANLLNNNIALDTQGGQYSIQNLWGTTVWNTYDVNENYVAFTVSMNPIDTTSGPDGLGWRTLTSRSTSLNVRGMRRFKCVPVTVQPGTSGDSTHTWSLCGYKTFNYIVGFFSSPWINPVYNQGPITADYLGATSGGDDFYDDIVLNLGSALNIGEVVQIDLDSVGGLTLGGINIRWIYITYEGIQPYNATLALNGLGTTPPFFLYNSCGSATGQSIVSPGDDESSRQSLLNLNSQNVLQVNNKQQKTLYKRGL